jgi:hypothetical protein
MALGTATNVVGLILAVVLFVAAVAIPISIFSDEDKKRKRSGLINHRRAVPVPVLAPSQQQKT